ncbi:hypothetical protein [Burkholderia lata]|uniref:hypothetical protein n=1 Tax=Burkholderia lata (strain ATCC 17760 / DSM 23089 / LMG 22485 / NCIMB 9086 / R18194 / 383) TaxID=482957 RepID=UPI00399BA582
MKPDWLASGRAFVIHARVRDAFMVRDCLILRTIGSNIAFHEPDPDIFRRPRQGAPT